MARVWEGVVLEEGFGDPGDSGSTCGTRFVRCRVHYVYPEDQPDAGDSAGIGSDCFGDEVVTRQLTSIIQRAFAC